MTFISPEQLSNIESNFETPVYVYSQAELEQNADNFLAFPSQFGHTVRYAMKANANKNILKIFNKKGIKIDASSEYEAYRAIASGYNPSDIQISGQETPRNLKELLESGVFFVATSLKQIEAVGKLGTVKNIGVRINPGVGSGAFKAIATGGTTSAFGIWYEYIDDAKQLAKNYDLTITKLHFHIGSENTPESWMNSAKTGLDMVEKFPDVDTFDMGGGFKKAIMPYEKSADLQAIGTSVAQKFQDFYEKTGRKIHLEVEPGKYMVINTCNVVAKVDDIVDTGKDGYTFIRTNTGMTEMPRVPMYGVQQPIEIFSSQTPPSLPLVKGGKEQENYVVVGHCCESGDLLTCKLYEQETIEEIELPKVTVGDTIVVSGTGAYNSSMSMKNYNSFPEAGELMILNNGEIKQIRTRQKMEDIWKNEVDIF